MVFSSSSSSSLADKSLFDTIEAKMAESRSRAPKGFVCLATASGAIHEVPTRDLGFDREAQAFFFRDEDSDDEEEVLCVVPLAQIEDISFPYKNPRAGVSGPIHTPADNPKVLGFSLVLVGAVGAVLILLYGVITG